MTTKTVATILIVALAGSATAAVQVIDQVQRGSADSPSIRSATSDGALFHLRLNSTPWAMHQRPTGVVYLPH